MSTSKITGKIDVSKIDKTKLYQGKTAKYLDIMLIPSSNDKYGNDYMIVQSLPKADRDAGVRGAILGNAKILGGGPSYGGGQAASQRRQPTEDEKANLGGGGGDSDVPFMRFDPVC
jgi:hypothetical protein